ncbi:uncharacterized protein PV09_04302 [Verruconis gallopava]|uniref:Uncharacterized protein n=1 Tax=Verruconis gallopava TaxID=253628 RepID=A0A0D2ACF9_9PEZI|nr:uncharacterized protein PV09_04302 [Verruconis gallopava]KIW04548.1 hypothetical protein PV09_04302 [Verruconis gallopava]
MGFLRDYEAKLSVSGDRLNDLERNLQDQTGSRQALVGLNESLQSYYLMDSRLSEWEKDSSEVREPAVVTENYRQAGIIRYLSDELVSMFPPPPPRSNSIPSAILCCHSDAQFSSSAFGDYAERHLRLIRELGEARRAYASLKQQCQELGYQLEEPTEYDDDDYQDVLNLMETGRPRIDAILAGNTADEEVTLPLPMKAMYAGQSSRIKSWLDNIENTCSYQMPPKPESDLPPEMFTETSSQPDLTLFVTDRDASRVRKMRIEPANGSSGCGSEQHKLFAVCARRKSAPDLRNY